MLYIYLNFLLHIADFYIPHHHYTPFSLVQHHHFRLYDSNVKTEAIKKKLELDGYTVTYKYEEPCMRGGGLELDESALFRVSWYPKNM